MLVQEKHYRKFVQIGLNIMRYRKERGLTQEQLARTLMPLGDYTKEEVRKIAEENGLVNANRKDSQEICFVEDNDYAGFIQYSL